MKNRAAVMLVLIVLILLSSSPAGCMTIPSTGSAKPEQTSAEPANSSEEPMDIVSGYLFVVDYLLSEDRDASRLPLKYLAVDSHSLVGLMDADKERFFGELKKYGQTILDKDLDELTAEGYIISADRVFEDGAWITMDKISVHGKKVTMDAYVYYAGLHGHGLLDFDITWDGSRWAITRTYYSVIS
jgi:hypothetical protein